jgi:glycine/D-amino acid oxidase-like deaminating enzyme/nitrite reductase/ring-hydroxylating ferredoxin subunit
MVYQTNPEQFVRTSGATDPVWIQQDKHSDRPHFQALEQDIETEVCIIGAGIAGISLAYELITRGKEVVLVEARDVLSGETGRTSGHLSNALDDGYVSIEKKHGRSGALAAAESHSWAISRVGEIAEQLQIPCEYHRVPGYMISQHQRGEKAKHQEDIRSIKEEVDLAKELGLEVSLSEDLAVKGWDGKPDQRGGAVFAQQASFLPTIYLLGILKWLKEQAKFQCFTHTRIVSVEEKTGGLFGGSDGKRPVSVHTVSGKTIECEQAIEATCVPLQKLSIIAEMGYHRTYCIAIRVPKGSVEDCLIYDTAEPYIYMRLTPCDDHDDYVVVGGYDHKVGQEDSVGRFGKLEGWVRERFTHAGSVDYQWSGQIVEPVDYVGFIGKNPGCNNIYTITGDSGNGLTQGVLAAKLIAEELEGTADGWAKLYSPQRMLSIARSLPELLAHDIQSNTQYKRVLQSDIEDIEDLAPGTGGVLNRALMKPVAVYKGEDGEIVKMSALCPHLKGVVCWNATEKSWDCPVHGSRFSTSGLCVQGPAKANLPRE